MAFHYYRYFDGLLYISVNISSYTIPFIVIEFSFLCSSLPSPYPASSTSSFLPLGLLALALLRYLVLLLFLPLLLMDFLLSRPSFPPSPPPLIVFIRHFFYSFPFTSIRFHFAFNQSFLSRHAALLPSFPFSFPPLTSTALLFHVKRTCSSYELNLISILFHFISDINECHSHPCQHSISCIDGINSYKCVCKPGYTGKNCETSMCEILTYAYHGSALIH